MDAEQTLVARIAGVALLVFGIGVLVLAIWIVERQLTMHDTIKPDAALLIMAAFMQGIVPFAGVERTMLSSNSLQRTKERCGRTEGR